MINTMKKTILFVILTLLSIVLLSAFSKTFAYSYNGIAWDKKMTSGKDIYYWVDSSISNYSSDISASKNMLRYPPGLWNPMVLNQTTTKSWSKIDYYGDDASGSSAASTLCFRPKVNGVEQPFTNPSQKDSENWLYAKVTIHKGHFNTHPTAVSKESLIILHETCHAYGGRDVYDDAHKSCIMYGWYDASTATGLDSAFNQVLVDKYNY